MADPYEVLVASTNQLYNAATLNQQANQAEDALDENKRQFDENMQWLREQYGSNLEFANRQHSEQMDFANRNLNANIENANNNLALQRDAFEYQKELNRSQMEREDSAMQRLIADYQKAGFSPLAAIGSSGSASSPLSSGAAPQRDMSGINQASGQYMDYAKQYAALTMQANQNYMNNRSQLAEKHNAEVLAAKQALIQMKQDSRFKAQSMSTEMFNAAVNYRDSMLNRDYIREQTKYLEDKHKWEEVNGYRSENFQSALVAAIKEFVKAKGDGETTIEKTFDLSKQMVEKAEEIVTTGSKNINKAVLEKVNDSNLSKTQKTAVMFYLSAIQMKLSSNRFVKGMRVMFDIGKTLYENVINRKDD